MPAQKENFMAVGAPSGVGSSRNGANVLNNNENRIAAINALTQKIRQLDLTSMPNLRLEYNQLKCNGKDALGNPADPELIRSMETLFTALSQINSALNPHLGYKY
jgi:hypothetical protein